MNIITADEVYKNFDEKKEVILREFIIEEDLYFADWNRASALTLVFRDCIIKGRLEINSLSESLNLHLRNSTFENTISIISSNVNLSVVKSTLNQYFSFSGRENCETQVRMEDVVSSAIISFEDCIFRTAMFNNIKQQKNTESLLRFTSIQFKGYITNFLGESFENLTFQNCSFKSNAGFGNIEKIKTVFTKANFFLTEFEKRALFDELHYHHLIFTEVAFKDHVSFVNSKNIEMNSSITFTRTRLHSTADFSSMQCGIADFSWTQFFETVNFIDTTFSSLLLSNSYFIKGCNFYRMNLVSADRETFRIIKNEFSKMNNKIDAIRFLSREMQAYQKELKFKKHKEEYILMLANKWSNDFGLKWGRGFLFTFIISLVFYSIYFASLSNKPITVGWFGLSEFIKGINIFLKYFIEFLLPTHSLSFMDNYGTSSMSYLIDIFGRILIGYGIYQTIAAFRKYGKMD